MSSTDGGLICGVCKKLMSDPHSLPCGHTFCLQHCLLSRAGAMIARCMHCQTTFSLAELTPNVAIATKLSLQKQTRKPNGKQTKIGECTQNSRYRLMLKSKLHDLSRQKKILLSQRPHSPKKNEIIDALDGAVKRMCLAAKAAFDGAIVKLEMMDKESCKNLNELTRRMVKFFTDVRGTQRVYASSNLVAGMKNTLAYQESLKQLTSEAALLKATAKNLRPPPITQMHVSDLVIKINRHLNDFNFLVRDDSILLPQSLPCTDIKGRSRTLTTKVYAGSTSSASSVQLFVSGLCQNHTKNKLRKYFSQYGVVTKCCIWSDFTAHMSKGCGFVTFQEALCATRALADRPHFIDGSPVNVEPSTLKRTRRRKMKRQRKNLPAATPLPKDNATSNDANADHKLVVDGLPPAPSANDIRSLFGRFGAVIGVKVEEKLHRATVAFSTLKALQMAVAAPPPRLKGMKLRVFLPRDQMRSNREDSNSHCITTDRVTPALKSGYWRRSTNQRANVTPAVVTAAVPPPKSIYHRVSSFNDNTRLRTDQTSPASRNGLLRGINDTRMPEKTPAVKTTFRSPQRLNTYVSFSGGDAKTQTIMPCLTRRINGPEEVNNAWVPETTGAVGVASPFLQSLYSNVSLAEYDTRTRPGSFWLVPRGTRFVEVDKIPMPEKKTAVAAASSRLTGIGFKAHSPEHNECSSGDNSRAIDSPSSDKGTPSPHPSICPTAPKIKNKKKRTGACVLQ